MCNFSLRYVPLPSASILTARFSPISFSIFFDAANLLRSHEATCTEVVAGYWGQPPEMTENNHQFIMVPGYLKSGKGEGMFMSLVEYHKSALRDGRCASSSCGFHTISRRSKCSSPFRQLNCLVQCTAEATCYGCYERINDLYVGLIYIRLDRDFEDTELML